MKSIEPVAIEMDIIINVIITVMVTLSERKRPQKKKPQKTDKYIIGYTHKNDEHVAPCWKRNQKSDWEDSCRFV